MTQKEEIAAIRAESRRLKISPLLAAMVHIIYQINGYDAALRCVREGAEQGI